MWRVRETIVAMENQQCSLFIVVYREVFIDNIIVLNVVEICTVVELLNTSYCL